MSAAPVPEAVVVVVSTRAAAGTRPDTTGPDLINRLKAAGWDVVREPRVVPDDETRLVTLLRELAGRHRLVVTTGGTGLTPTDRTPEATIKAGERQVPGIAEMIRAAGLATTPLAALSRGVVVTRGQALIVNLPGSPRGAAQSLEAAIPVLRHAVDQLGGGDHHG
jgi:molybdenum cofactor synthesis domain-containing protein